jgi:hypothetical protein
MRKLNCSKMLQFGLREHFHQPEIALRFPLGPAWPRAPTIIGKKCAWGLLKNSFQRGHAYDTKQS